MIYQRSLIRELTQVAMAVFTVLLAIVVITQVIKLFGRAAAGQLASEAIVAMVGFSTLGLFSVLMSLTLFISILVVLTRLYRDSEMAVWLTAGLSPRAWIRPVLSFAVPLTVLIALVSLFLAPWAKGKGNEYAHLLKQREEVSALAPGVFKEAQGGKRVYFIERYSAEDGAAKHLFVQQVEASGKLSTIFAQEGRVQTDDRTGERTLLLSHGRRYEGEAGQADFRVVDFLHYRVKIERGLKPLAEHAASTRSTALLWASQSRLDRGELAWRLSFPISALILALLAIPLAYYNPRAGHTFNLVIALFVYLFYYNAIGVVESLIARGKLPALAAMLPLHLGMFVVFVGLMAWRTGALSRWLGKGAA